MKNKNNDTVQTESIAVKTPEEAKALVVESLLKNIKKVDLKQVCKNLGWNEGDESQYPKQKHIKVAIIYTLINTAKNHNWHVIHNEGFFYIFNGAFWVALQDNEVKQLLKNAAIKMGYLEIECRDVSFVDKLFQQATQDGFFSERNLKKQSIVNLKNGSLVLNERGATLKKFDYRDFLTHQLDFDHTPTAVNHLFQQYLDDVLPNKDTQKTLQQVAGYLFIKGLKLELTFFLYGTGANGKSVFFEIINGVIGSENISNYSLESLTDEKGYHRAMIKDKIVNYGTDIRLTKIDSGMFKTLSSGEPIDARLPYRDPFTMTDYAKLIFNVNKMDSANVEHTHGFFRRFLIIPFNETIPDAMQDKDLHKKILTNRAGVLNWMIEGAKEVVKNRNIFVSAECELFKKQLMKETDSVAMFEEHIIKENLRGNFYTETISNSHANYKNYCLDAGFKPLGLINFSKRMEAIGFTKSKQEMGNVLQKKFF